MATKKVFDPTCDPVEPYFRRLRREYNLTQSELAREAQISSLAVLRNEHLCYHTPLPNVATALALYTGVPLKIIIHEYHIDVSRRRKYTSETLLPLALDDPIQFLHTVNFKDWRIFICIRENLPTSVIKFSSMICVNPSTITDYEKRQSINSNASIPAALRVAWNEMYGSHLFGNNVKLDF